jgi:hypothetical protein
LDHWVVQFPWSGSWCRKSGVHNIADGVGNSCYAYHGRRCVYIRAVSNATLGKQMCLLTVHVDKHIRLYFLPFSYCVCLGRYVRSLPIGSTVSFSGLRLSTVCRHMTNEGLQLTRLQSSRPFASALPFSFSHRTNKVPNGSLLQSWMAPAGEVKDSHSYLGAFIPANGCNTILTRADSCQSHGQ